MKGILPVATMKRFRPAVLISARNAFASIFITFYISATVEVDFVIACQLCFRNILPSTGTANPVSSRHLMSLPVIEPCSSERDSYLEVRERLTFKTIDRSGQYVSFIARKRHRNQPLFMMFNHDNSIDNTTILSGTDIPESENDTNTRNFALENDMTKFDSVKFFDDLQRSGGAGTNDTNTEEKEDAVSAVMIGAIGFYKKVISPALPPACRFVPTCSSYGVQAIQEFGPAKGLILIAWRILRCTPVGGRGYDPPKWPPVFYTFSSY
jgi:hypothetical protein